MDFKLFLAVFLIWVATSDASDEHKLIKSLLKTYQDDGRQLARPVSDSSDTLKVKFGMSLVDVEMNEKARQLTLHAWLNYAWKDEYLVWNPSDFSGVKSVNIAPSEIWKPDIVPYNSLGIDVENVQAVVSNEGSVMLISPMTMRKSCTKLAGGLFTKSKFSCPMVFGSWVHNGNQLDLEFFSEPEIDIAYYAGTDAWTVGDHSAVKEDLKYPCCPEIYPRMQFNLTLTEN